MGYGFIDQINYEEMSASGPRKSTIKKPQAPNIEDEPKTENKKEVLAQIKRQRTRESKRVPMFSELNKIKAR